MLRNYPILRALRGEAGRTVAYVVVILAWAAIFVACYLALGGPLR